MVWNNVDEKTWPSVDTAYQFVLPSYQMMLTRFEAADTRLTVLLTLTSTLTLGAPIFARSIRPDISFHSPLLTFGIFCFFVGAIAGMVGRSFGSVTLPNPMRFYESSLHCDPWEFKKNAIYFAGDAFTLNARVINGKGNIAAFVTGIWLLEMLCLVTWLVA